jgi:hypothetical protein
MDNDMANGVIKNAQTIAFRGSTKNIGDNLTGVLAIDCSIADVHYGTLSGDVILDFQKWAPAGTRGTVEVIFTVIAGQKIEITDAVKYGVDTIKGYTVPSSGNPYIVVPAGVTRVHYVFSSLDCGTTIEINQTDDSRIATRIKTGEPLSDGLGTLSFAGYSLSGSTITISASTNISLKSGDKIYSTDNIFLGTIAEDVSGKTVKLNGYTTTSGTYSYRVSSLKGKSADKKGDILVNESFVYVCGKDYTNGVDDIWFISGNSGSSSSGSSASVMQTLTVNSSLISKGTATFSNITSATNAKIGNSTMDSANITSANITTANIAGITFLGSKVTNIDTLTLNSITTTGSSRSHLKNVELYDPIINSSGSLDVNTMTVGSLAVSGSLTGTTIITDNLRKTDGTTWSASAGSSYTDTDVTNFLKASGASYYINTSNTIQTTGNINGANVTVGPIVLFGGNGRIQSNTLFVGNSTSNVSVSSGNITATGNINSSSVFVGGSTSNIRIDGSVGNINATNNIIAGNNSVYVRMNGTTGSLSMSGDISANNVSISGSLTLTDDADILSVAGNMDMTGNSILNVANISANNITATNFVKGRIAAKTQSGTPQGSIAGEVGEILIDVTGSRMYVCTTSGTAATAVWKSTLLS